MRAYVGQTRSRDLIVELNVMGWGEMAVRGELPAKRQPWAFDNGAFADWKAGRPFDAERFQRDVERMVAEDWRPDFFVVPDIVAGGERSLEFSLGWLGDLQGISAPAYLAVQDGMGEASVVEALESFDGLFVGGTLDWKRRTGHRWVELAHAAGKPCHVGRVGTMRRVAWALRIGADSIDSSLPLWSAAKLDRFRRALADPQLDLEATTWAERVARGMGAA